MIVGAAETEGAVPPQAISSPVGPEVLLMYVRAQVPRLVLIDERAR